MYSKVLIVYVDKIINLKTDVIRQLEERERTWVVLKSLPCVSQDQSPPCYVICLSTLLSILVHSLDSKAYSGDDRAERPVGFIMAEASVEDDRPISEAIMEKALSFIKGVKIELCSQEQTEVLRGLFRILSSDEPQLLFEIEVWCEFVRQQSRNVSTAEVHFGHLRGKHFQPEIKKTIRNESDV